MAKIEIYARMRPTNRQYEGIKVTQDSESGHDHIHIHIGEQERASTPSRYSKSHPTSHNFQFKRVFEGTATQEEVFGTVSKNIIDSFLGGYNGTIFAYGQTSSGKTHTIEGNGRKFADRGIIPRTLSYIYREVERRTGEGEDASIHISYMEIYQDTGYDLLNPGMRPGALMVTLPKINISEGAGGRVIIRNLSSHLAASEEVAQSLLFQGSTCRKVAETSMNQCSSRSHSIFTITLTVKSADSEIITKSKLNLVDLAGSERVAKTGADGRILQEAKHINLSLHHLEHVIITLQSHLKSSTSRHSISPSPSRTGGALVSSKSRDLQQSPHSSKSRESLASSSSFLRPGTRGNHVPYRNCMLTMVLKDSLGGNCLTAMIATISAEEDNLGETVSTLRFSQRVACISNRARKNEELDDKAVIKKLKHRIAELESEVASLKDRVPESVVSPSDGYSSTSQSLTDQEKILCHQILHGFFHGKIDNPVTAGINTSARFYECLQVLKMVVLQALGISKQSASSSTHHEQVSTQAKELASQMRHSHPTPPTTTPSPNSRLSSGFGSLVDTDGVTTCESSHNQEAFSPQHTQSPSHQQVITATPPPAQSVRDQLREQRIQKKTERKLQKQSRQAPVFSPPNSKLAYQEMKNGVPGLTVSEHSPRRTGKAWMSPVTSPDSSINQSHSPVSRHHITPPIKQTSPPMGLPAKKPLSPRDENNMHKLLLRQEELKQSKHERNNLTSQVQMLDIHVEEEKLRAELESVGEQLAQQHALVSRLQKTDSDWEQLYAEKIAEQQLRIKQAKIHQRLTDLQYYSQSSHQQSSVSAGSVRSPQSLTPDRHQWAIPAVKSHLPPQSSKIQKELEKNDLRQTKVQNQIEKLRMSQIEKQLELKEASTRRKILALKQQLVSKHTTAVSQPGTGTDARTRSQPEPTRSHTLTTSPHTPEKAKINSVSTPNTTEAQKKEKNTQQSKPAFSPLQREQFDRESPIRRIVYSSPSTSSPHSSHRDTAPPREAHSKQASYTNHSPIVQQSVKKDGKEPPASNRPSTECSSKSTAKSPPLPVKLTLPEEIKETEYMTAVQRQKARVSRIRRCIVAATVIQRAWRRYKQT